MRRAAILICCFLAGTAMATPPDDPRTADRTAIVAGERAWGQAYVQGDVIAARALLDEDFSGIDPLGKSYGKEQALADIASVPHSSSDQVDAITLRFFGNTAIVQAHEHEIGPPPELRPAERVFTDVWIKRGTRWTIVAAEDVDPGLATVPEYQAQIAVIHALRSASNQAIAKHDLTGFLALFADDAVFTWSNGTSAVGKAALRAFFAHDFADPNFDRYIRTPQSISISSTGARAVEHGTWTALKAGTHYGGDYVGHWMKRPEGWRVQGELYVKLYCTGSLCTP